MERRRTTIDRKKKPPFGFAPPAGHVDGDASFEESAKRELTEEVGLEALSTKLIAEGRKNNPCRREGGSWHYWKIYQIESPDVIKRSEDETKQAFFCKEDELTILASKTEQYARGDISQDDWEKSPGLEPVWYEWLKGLKVI